MSQSIGPFCNLEQDITSWNQSEGAAVGLELVEYERESKIISGFPPILHIFCDQFSNQFFSNFFPLGDQCPMYFDDGSDPWVNNEIGMLILDVGDASCLHSLPLLATFCAVISSLVA